jgi:cold shock CspA family protein
MVKWFNNKTGYGFITVLDGEQHHLDKDIFVHYKSIRSANDEYKYLVQGEYVEFDVVRPLNEKHEFHAVDITGVKTGPTMCETRRVASLLRTPDDDRESVKRIVRRGK